MRVGCLSFTLRRSLCRALKRAPKRPLQMETSAMKGSCTSHSLLPMSFTPFTDSTPRLHLYMHDFPVWKGHDMI